MPRTGREEMKRKSRRRNHAVLPAGWRCDFKLETPLASRQQHHRSRTALLATRKRRHSSTLSCKGAVSEIALPPDSCPASSDHCPVSSVQCPVSSNSPPRPPQRLPCSHRLPCPPQKPHFGRTRVSGRLATRCHTSALQEEAVLCRSNTAPGTPQPARLGYAAADTARRDTR